MFSTYFDLSKEERIEFNKKLISKYPFLLPRNSWTGEVIEDYDYSWTEADEIPRGWLLAFGELFFNELLEELTKFNCIKDYRVIQIKEKFGELRWYDAGHPQGSKVSDIIEKYSILSGNICINCGKPDVPMVNDWWISPYCEDCWVKHRKTGWSSYKNLSDSDIAEEYKKLTKNNDVRMSNTYNYTTYKDGNKIEHCIDISDTANYIRKFYISTT